MSLSFAVSSDTGRTLVGTIQQITAGGSLGNIWDNVAGSWAGSPTTANRSIALAEGTGVNIGTYTGGTGTLPGYSGLVLKRIHDVNQSHKVIGTSLSYLLNGVEARYAGDSDLTPIATNASTAATQSTTAATQATTAATQATTAATQATTAATQSTTAATQATSAASQATTAATQATTAATQATTAATNSTTLTTRLTATRATNLDNLDAAVTTRSTLTALQVYNELIAKGGVPATNMRGTDNALLAANYTAPANADITSALSQATTAATNSTTLTTRLSAARAGYLDNLSAGAVALEASLTNVANAVQIAMVGPGQMVVPGSGSTTYTFDLFLYDLLGNMEAADATPTFAAVNAAGTSRSANLSAVTSPSAGQYRITYAVASTHSVEQIILTATIVENGKTLTRSVITPVISVTTLTGDTFTASDRTKLEAVHGKLPSKSYLAGTNAADGDINLDEADGSRTPFKADVSLLATATALSAVATTATSTLTQATTAATQATTAATNAVAMTDRITTTRALKIDNLDATISSAVTQALAATNQATTAATQATTAASQSTTAASQATTAATQATTAATQATTAATNTTTLTTRLSDARAVKLDNLDAAISTRSTFNAGTTNVTVTPGTLALEASVQAVKAKTDKIGTTVAQVSDIPTAGAIAAQVDSVLTTNHPGNWAGGGDATLAKQNQILSAVAAVVPSPPSVVYVSGARTWTLLGDGSDWYAPNVLTLASNFSGVVAMDFSNVLNPGTGVSSVSSVTDLSGNSLTASTLLPSQDRNAAHFTVSNLVAGTRYDLLVTIGTSDGQTISGRGTLRCES